MQQVNVVKQQDIKDCGVCSLLAIIRYYKGNVAMEKLRLDTMTDTNGTNALNLIEAARKYGFDASGVKIDSLYQEDLKLPAIAHIITESGLEHFVVVTKISKDLVFLMDPAKGNVKMPYLEFKKLWDGVLLLFYPKTPIIFMPKENNLLDIFIKIVKQEKGFFLSIIITSILLCLLTIINSFYFKVALESISLNQDLDYLKIIILIFALLLIFKLIFSYLRQSLENYLNKNIDVTLLSNFIRHIFKIPLLSIEARTSGEITTRVKEIINIKSLFTDIFISIILDLLLSFITMPLLYIIDHNLFWIIIFLVILYLLVGILTSKIIYKKAYRNIELEQDFNTILLEEITMMSSLKNLKLTKEALRKIEHSLATFLYDNFKVMSFFNKQGNLKLWLNEIGLFIINSLGFILICQNKLTIANLITFNSLITYFFDPFKNIIDTIPKFNFLKASFTKINEFLSIKEEEEGQAISLLKPTINITNLSYSYDNYHVVINNLSKEIKNGEMVLLKGNSGCGKSTFCKILDKFLTDYTGEIYLNNINIKDYSLATIRDNVTYISQNEALRTGTIKENIICLRNIDETLFHEVCKVCEVDSIINKKPLRYATIISNDSSFISGGERQRIILARALLKPAEIYLIDEALSEVDYEMERRIIKNLQKFLKGKIVIYVTHKNQDDLFKKRILLEAKNGL